MPPDVITVTGVSKRFRIGGSPHPTALSAVLSALSTRSAQRDIWAVRDVSFRVRRGEVFGIVGRNGSGKSTLLSLLAGIYPPTMGSVHVQGRVVSLTDLGLGMHAKLTMAENIYLGCSCLNMSRADTEAVFDKIVRFSGLQDFLPVRLWQFSSGMRSRLGFSIAVHAPADVLLLDEVLTAGDDTFRERAEQRVRKLMQSKRTVVYVTHSATQARELCRRVLWLESGRPMLCGKADWVIDAYQNFTRALQAHKGDRVFA